MSVNIEMPKLSDTMTEGTLVKWHKQIGDTVEIGDILAEIETDKATMEMEAFDDGILTDILIKEGEKALIGGVLAILDGDSLTAASPSSNSPATAISKAPAPAIAAAKSASIPASASASGDRIKISPLARKMAADLGIDINTLTGSGPAGRIVKNDVLESSKSIAKSPAPSSDATAAAALANSIKTKSVSASTVTTPSPLAIIPTAKDGDLRIELSSMRKIIASRLLTSKTTIPHFYLHLEVLGGDGGRGCDGSLGGRGLGRR